MSGPYSNEAQHHRRDDIGAGTQPRPLLHQRERPQAQGGERGVAAAMPTITKALAFREVSKRPSGPVSVKNIPMMKEPSTLTNSVPEGWLAS